MDGNLKPAHSGTVVFASGAMPPERPLDMPIAGFGNMTVLQGVMIFFFAVTLGWIAFAASSAVAGFVLPTPRAPEAPLGESRTALLMPVYNEEPTHTTAALQAMAEALDEAGAARYFEIVIVSDSTSANAWIAETMAIDRLRRALNGVMPVRYRRRWHNTGRKVGNVEEFIKRWGGHYDYMVVLDADSLMSAATLVSLVKRMQADPELALLQTVPTLIGQQSLFARLQQFASCVFGNVIARGVAGWSGDDGNYWGHNALVRVSAFAQACGLPQLPGRKPFGGHVLSHDFIEAAFLRRAGWKVRMAPDLQGSWEQGPPSLVDMAIRDRRWAQGNLQHLKLLRARGLTWTSRKHLAIGIMSYLSSPLWLLLILVGFALTLQARLIRPEYFSHSFQLFPNWPVFDSERMVSLFVFSMAVLLAPKTLGFVRSLFTARIRRGSGGSIGLTASMVFELVLSALYAPIMILIQTQHVFDILTGGDSDWTAQRREAAALSWRDAWHLHWKHTFVGIVIAAVAWLLSPTLLAWLSPAVLGLMLAVPLSRSSGSVRLGRWLRYVSVFRTPEESAPDAMIRRRNELVAATAPLPKDGLHHLARDSAARVAHLAGNLQRPRDARGHPQSQRLTAESKVAQAQSLREALDWLSGAERIEVAADALLLERLAKLPD